MRIDEERDEEARQREEAKQTLAGPVHVDAVRAARLRRLDTTTNGAVISPPPIPESGGGEI